jgi:radical SAM-linked protein
MKLRIQFHKLGPVRFTSHKDTIRMFQRCFASSGIPVSYSEGFHPHMRLSFAPPLKTGWEGLEEYLDVEVDGPPGEIRDTCNTRLPDGLRINRVCVLSDRARKIAADVSAVTISARLHRDDVDAERVRDAGQALRGRFLAAPGNGTEPRVLDAAVSPDERGVEVRYTTTSVSGKTVGPAEVVEAVFGDPGRFEVPIHVTRTAQFVERGGEFVSPISKGVLLNRS